MAKFLGFGEVVAGYEVRVLNEREVRAAAGILFLLALIAFMNAWLLGNFHPTRTFVVAFLLDFTVRICINPAFAPSLILGRFMVRNQTPEYVGAPQKRFAWLIGLGLALAMAYLVVVEAVIGPVNLLICLVCLTLMFFESVFGICLGCKVYNRLFRVKVSLCPGNACAAKRRHDIQKIGFGQQLTLVVFLGLMVWVAQQLAPSSKSVVAPEAASSAACTPPDWAVAMGHGEMWKLHHGCR